MPASQRAQLLADAIADAIRQRDLVAHQATQFGRSPDAAVDGWRELNPGMAALVDYNEGAIR